MFEQGAADLDDQVQQRGLDLGFALGQRIGQMGQQPGQACCLVLPDFASGPLALLAPQRVTGRMALGVGGRLQRRDAQRHLLFDFGLPRGIGRANHLAT